MDDDESQNLLFLVNNFWMRTYVLFKHTRKKLKKILTSVRKNAEVDKRKNINCSVCFEH